jgi:excisionase family DNA binding protein
MTEARAIQSGPELETVPQFSRRAKISERKTWAMIEARELAVVRLGRSVRIPISELDRLIQEARAAL